MFLIFREIFICLYRTHVKYIIWLWSKYVKRRHIPYMELEFHYPNYLFIVLGSIVCAIILGIAIAYFSIK